MPISHTELLQPEDLGAAVAAMPSGPLRWVEMAGRHRVIPAHLKTAFCPVFLRDRRPSTAGNCFIKGNRND